MSEIVSRAKAKPTAGGGIVETVKTIVYAVLIAGNERENRIPALREFWRRMAHKSIWHEWSAWPRFVQSASYLTTVTAGLPGFFVPMMAVKQATTQPSGVKTTPIIPIPMRHGLTLGELPAGSIVVPAALYALAWVLMIVPAPWLAVRDRARLMIIAGVGALGVVVLGSGGLTLSGAKVAKVCRRS